jgi:hypothetical protein
MTTTLAVFGWAMANGPGDEALDEPC